MTLSLSTSTPTLFLFLLDFIISESFFFLSWETSYLSASMRKEKTLRLETSNGFNAQYFFDLRSNLTQQQRIECAYSFNHQREITLRGSLDCQHSQAGLCLGQIGQYYRKKIRDKRLYTESLCLPCQDTTLGHLDRKQSLFHRAIASTNISRMNFKDLKQLALLRNKTSHMQ